MHVPKIFENADTKTLEQFIRSNPFGMMISQSNGRIEATHIPMELVVDENNRWLVRGHISKANEQWKTFEEGNEIMIVFQGAHSYISSSWYGHLNVPTWNYIAVHVYGAMRIQSDEELRNALTDLMNRYESPATSPVSMDKLPETYVHAQIKGIVGFEVAVNRIQGAYKLSQNRNDADYRNIIAELEKLNEHNATLIAAEMKKSRQQ